MATSTSKTIGPTAKNSVWGDHIEGRRARIGFKSKWFQNWKFEGQIDAYTEFEDANGDGAFYKNLYDLYITYVQSDALNISAGKPR